MQIGILNQTKTKVTSWQEIMDIVEHPEQYKLWVLNSKTYINMSFKQFNKLRVVEVKSRIERGALYYTKLTK